MLRNTAGYVFWGTDSAKGGRNRNGKWVRENYTELAAE